MTNIRYEDHSDGVREKLRLLEAAYAAGNLDVAMSLADSMKDTLAFERETNGILAEPAIGADRSVSVASLPKAWADWARGWEYCKGIDLFETVGIERSGEPVDLAIAFRADQTSDPIRDVRAARRDPASNTLVEIPCQLYGEARRGGERRCRLVFAADVPAHQHAQYFLFYGNPLAERPDYATDLHVEGTGYALDVENQHFLARLSRQTGQLERLTYKRQHGLELYAGGKGHGEPPDIDWGHDYVDAGHFQKLRMRNWAACPNHEVVRGPLCARIRRWGFPHGPVHPVFTPSRIHMDQTYVFYAGVPYFFKEGRMDVVRDVEIEAMRDDEWVFSGYSFSDLVWFDRQGRMHEGAVPEANTNDLWGVGFYHRTSRDAFVALWLEHAAENFDALAHGGPPTLHYDGHGQLWSRYPVDKHALLKAGTTIRQRNAYVVLPMESQGAALVERLRHQLLNPLVAQAADVPREAAARASGRLARMGETRETAPLKPAIWEALRKVRDEQLYKTDANVVDMGYVYDVRERNGIVQVLVTMPHRGRPVYQFLETQGGGRVEEGIRERLAQLPGVRRVVVDFTWEPPWSVARLSDEARQALDLPASDL